MMKNVERRNSLLDLYNETKKIKFSDISDIVKITYQDDLFLRSRVMDICNDTWSLQDASFLAPREAGQLAEHGRTGFGIPSDLFFSKTLPIKGVEIVCDERGDGGIVMPFKICIADDYEKIVDDVFSGGSGTRRVVGKVETTRNMRSNVTSFIEIAHGVKGVLIYTVSKGILDIRQFLAIRENRIAWQRQKELAFDFLVTWYSVQIMMLHPEVRTVFQNPVKVKGDRQNQSRNGRKAHYVKVHTIKKEDMEKRIRRDINRKCLCWYVIGHWREYQNGRKIFIQGYWKGALRQTKKNQDAGRERALDI